MAKLRLRDLDPEAVAAAAYESVSADAERRAKAVATALANAPANPTRSPVYRTVLRLARYAITGDYPTDDWTVGSDVEPLCGCFSAGQLMQKEPESPLALVVAAAYAREKLDTGRHLTSPELAVLTGIDRDHLNRLAASGAIPGAHSSDTGRRPWMYKPTAKLRAWIASHHTPATQDPTHGNASRP